MTINRKVLEDVCKSFIRKSVVKSNSLKEQLTFKEHINLISEIDNLTYDQTIKLLFNEDIRAFEGKFSKFLKYGLAALLAMKSGVFKGNVPKLAVPGIGMMILYLYRQATDDCKKQCFKKIPFTRKRKVCILECKIKALRDLTNDIRSEIVKCQQFANADKCEKKLRKTYIKWAKKLQELIIQYRKLAADAEEEERKYKERQLAARRKDILTQGNEIDRGLVLSLISESSIIRGKLTFENHLKLYHAVKNMPEEYYLKLEETLFFDESKNKSSDIEQYVKPPTIDPRKEKKIRQAMYLGLWVLPIPFFNDLINYIAKKYNYACMAKCLNTANAPKDLCYKQCRYLSTKQSVDFLEKQLTDCKKHKKPSKCQKKIFKLLKDWKQREVDAKIKYEGSLRQHRIV